jgi:hypothetical protein
MRQAYDANGGGLDLRRIADAAHVAAAVRAIAITCTRNPRTTELHAPLLRLHS